MKLLGRIGTVRFSLGAQLVKNSRTKKKPSALNLPEIDIVEVYSGGGHSSFFRSPCLHADRDFSQDFLSLSFISRMSYFQQTNKQFAGEKSMEMSG